MSSATSKENANLKASNLTTGKRKSSNVSADIPKNSAAHVSKTNADIETVNLAERTLVTHLKDCRIIMDQIKDKADHSTEELSKTLMEIFNAIKDNFELQIKNQAKENEKMQLKVDKLKQEKNEIQKLIVECSKRCTHLEEDLGKYPL